MEGIFVERQLYKRKLSEMGGMDGEIEVDGTYSLPAKSPAYIHNMVGNKLAKYHVDR